MPLLETRINRLERAAGVETFEEMRARMECKYSKAEIDSFVAELERRPVEHADFFADNGYFPDWEESEQECR